ncbi:MAG: hypothetical protein AB7N76_33620 [Planctomycetota bacterium]
MCVGLPLLTASAPFLWPWLAERLTGPPLPERRRELLHSAGFVLALGAIGAGFGWAVALVVGELFPEAFALAGRLLLLSPERSGALVGGAALVAIGVAARRAAWSRAEERGDAP